MSKGIWGGLPSHRLWLVTLAGRFSGVLVSVITEGE